MVVGMVVGMGRHMLFALPLIWDMRYALLYPVCHYSYPVDAPRSCPGFTLQSKLADLAGVSLQGKGGPFLWDLKRRLTLTSIRGWARLRLARARQVVGLCSRQDLTPDVPRYEPNAPMASADGLYDAFASATSPSMFW